MKIINLTTIMLRNNKATEKKLVKDFKGDWDHARKDCMDAFDEEGVFFYTFKENKNKTRMELKWVDPEGNGVIEIFTRYEGH